MGIELANGMRVPTRGLELIYYFVMINILYVTVQKDKLRGRAYPLFMLSYGAFRFIIEFFSEANTVYFGVFHIAHLWSAVSVAAGLTALLILRKTIRKGV